MTDPADPAAAAPQLRSRLSRKWTIKIGIIALALIGLGVAGLYDALVGYPRRGQNAAEYLEYQYLQQLSSDQSRASVADPSARLLELNKKEKEGAPLSLTDQTLVRWLEQLKMVGKLEPASASTIIPRTDFRTDDQGKPIQVKDAGQRLADLKKSWTTSAGTPKQASPLSWMDIPSQWVIVALGLGFGGWLIFVLLSARAKVYRWDPAREVLTLPDGASIAPQDIAEFDKRKWHRLFITLKIKPSHPQLGGKDVTLDLLRFDPVEDWVLAMEKTAGLQPTDAPAATP